MGVEENPQQHPLRILIKEETLKGKCVSVAYELVILRILSHF